MPGGRAPSSGSDIAKRAEIDTSATECGACGDTAVAGFTYNFENPSTNYQNGIDSHLDWAASQFLSENWEVGIAGYAYDQLTADSGSGDRVGSFESGVAAVGPEVGYVFNVGKQQWYANLRGYYEFWAQNRVQGYDLFMTLNMPFGD